LPAAIKQGIAPAMMCDITKPFWGGEASTKDNGDARKLCGCKPEKEVSKTMRKVIDKCGPDITAREVMQNILAEEAGEDLPLPERLPDQKPPEDPNVYSDGSLKNPGVGPHWMIGGIGGVVAGSQGGDAAEDRGGGEMLKKHLRRSRPPNVERLQRPTK